MSYCSIDDVQRYLSPHKPYTGVIADKIENFIKDIDIDIDSLLLTLGIRLPIPTTETKFLEFLKYWATIGASGKTELSLHGPNEDPRVMGYGQMLWSQYEQWKKMMLSHLYDLRQMINDSSLLTETYQRFYQNNLWYSLTDPSHEEVPTIFGIHKEIGDVEL